MAYPADYKYTKEHEWLKIDGKTGVIGITDYAQNSLGDIVFVELPKVGSEISAGKTFGSVESVKAVSDLFAPVSGTVTEINEALNTAPEQVNKDANATWMIKVELEGSERGERTAFHRRLREVRRRRGRRTRDAEPLQQELRVAFRFRASTSVVPNRGLMRSGLQPLQYRRQGLKPSSLRDVCRHV